MNIRQAERKDHKEIKRLLKDLPINYPDGEQWLENKLADTSDPIFIALAEQQIIGITILALKNDKLKIANIFVHPQFRNRGYGQKLLTTAFAFANEQDITSFYITYDSQVSPALPHLLEKHGFVQVAVLRGRYHKNRTEIVAARNDI